MIIFSNDELENMLNSEDENSITQFEEPVVVNSGEILEGPCCEDDTAISNLIFDTIQQELSNARYYNEMLVNIREDQYKELYDTFKELANNSNKAVGILQGLLAKISPNAEQIKAGYDEVSCQDGICGSAAVPFVFEKLNEKKGNRWIAVYEDYSSANNTNSVKFRSTKAKNDIVKALKREGLMVKSLKLDESTNVKAVKSCVLESKQHRHNKSLNESVETGVNEWGNAIQPVHAVNKEITLVARANQCINEFLRTTKAYNNCIDVSDQILSERERFKEDFIQYVDNKGLLWEADTKTINQYNEIIDLLTEVCNTKRSPMYDNDLLEKL